MRNLDDNWENISKWLSAPDPSVNLNSACKKRNAETGSWLLNSKQYLDWQTHPNSFLWLHGFPGCGKTVLSSTIVKDVLRNSMNNSHLAVAYFFFDFNDHQKQLSDNMVRSIVTQLSRQNQDTSNVLITLFSSCKGREQPTTNALMAALQQMTQGSDDVYIILDALDECEDRFELLKIIEVMNQWKLDKVHVLVTSRKEKDIEELLGPLIEDEKEISIQSALVNDDIRAFVRERLKTDSQLRRWKSRPQVQQEIEDALMSKVAGM